MSNCNEKHNLNQNIHTFPAVAMSPFSMAITTISFMTVICITRTVIMWMNMCWKSALRILTYVLPTIIVTCSPLINTPRC